MPSTLNVPAPVRKSTQALNYFARLSASGAPRAEINKMKALKLLFFADRYHLRKYGRTVSDCVYFAMAKGPVASEAKRIAEDAKRLDPRSRSYAHRFVRQKGDTFDYTSVAEVDLAVLSKTDVEALDFAWQTFGHYTEFELVEITHKYPEWRKHASKLRHDGKRVEMDCADFFADPVAGYNPCHELSAKDRKVALELFCDQQAFDQRWS